MSTKSLPANLPEKLDPKEVAAITADIAKQATRLLTAHFRRQIKKTASGGVIKRLKNGLRPPADELGIGAAYKAMFGRMLTNPVKIAQAQVAMAQEFVALWQYSMRRAAGRLTCCGSWRKSSARLCVASHWPLGMAATQPRQISVRKALV